MFMTALSYLYFSIFQYLPSAMLPSSPTTLPSTQIRRLNAKLINPRKKNVYGITFTNICILNLLENPVSLHKDALHCVAWVASTYLPQVQALRKQEWPTQETKIQRRRRYSK